MTILLADPQVRAVPVHETGDPLVRLPDHLGYDVWVRSALADRLQQAAATLPDGLRLVVVEGHRSAVDQAAIAATYLRRLLRDYPEADGPELARLSSRFVAPLPVAPHVAGAAVDLTLVDADGRELDLGTAIDATPEDSDGACWFAAPTISPAARRLRDILATALGGAGLVNYPTEWWHWSYGDRYWALTTGADHALYGPLERQVAA